MDEKEMRQIHAQSNLMEHLRNLLFSEGLDGCLTGPKFILLSQPVVRENPTGYENANSVEWQQLFSVNVRTFASVEDLVWFARWVDSMGRSKTDIDEPSEWLADAEGGRAENIHGSFEWREPKQTIDSLIAEATSSVSMGHVDSIPCHIGPIHCPYCKSDQVRPTGELGTTPGDFVFFCSECNEFFYHSVGRDVLNATGLGDMVPHRPGIDGDQS